MSWNWASPDLFTGGANLTSHQQVEGNKGLTGLGEEWTLNKYDTGKLFFTNNSSKARIRLLNGTGNRPWEAGLKSQSEFSRVIPGPSVLVRTKVLVISESLVPYGIPPRPYSDPDSSLDNCTHSKMPPFLALSGSFRNTSSTSAFEKWDVSIGLKIIWCNSHQCILIAFD